MLFAPGRITGTLNSAFLGLFGWCMNIDMSHDRPAAGNPQINLDDYVPRSEYNKLLTEYDNLVADLIEMQNKYETLSGMASDLPAVGAGLLIADVIKCDITAGRHEMIINKGSDDGIAENQYVLGGSSVIGTILRAYEKTARVRLITDPASAIPVKISAQGNPPYINAVMTGKALPYAVIANVPKKYKVAENYRVYAEKKPGLLDVRRITGRVAKCMPDENSPLLWDIRVAPACDFKRLSQVGVIITKFEIQELQK